MIAVEAAQARILAALTPLPAEIIGLAQAAGRVLAAPLSARRSQPPFAVSAMDGYAVQAADFGADPTILRVIGSVPAGGSFDGSVTPGTALRIFTGAPIPDGADTVVLQENTIRDGAQVTISGKVTAGRHIRPAGGDFTAGMIGLAAGTRLTARHIGLAAAMNHPWVPVHRRPRVAILANGDELVLPGEPLGPHQIISANGNALAALVEAAGGIALQLPFARDDAAGLQQRAKEAAGADLLLTIGGASVGEHDLVKSALTGLGMTLDFVQIAMRPGKPVMFGRLGPMPFLGLPGNPVSALVCGLLFLLPALERLQGLAGSGPRVTHARSTLALAANDHRQDYLRASLQQDADGGWRVTPFPRQDSSILSSLAAADALIIRPPQAPALAAGEMVPMIRLAGTGF